MDLNGRNVLVCGGAGFIGSHLVERLRTEKPRNIVVLDNLFLGQLSNLETAKKLIPGLKLWIRDASNLQALEEIIKAEKIDVVFDLATIPLPASYVHPVWTYTNNVDIVLNFCELLRRDEFSLYVHTSSSEAYGTAISVPMREDHPMNPTTTYGASKASQDLAIQAFDRMYDLDYLILRPFNNFGERQNDRMYAAVIPITIGRILRGERPVRNGDGLQTRDYIYVKDTVDAFVRLSKNDSCRKQIVNVARGTEVTIGDLIQLVCKLMNYVGPVEVGPARSNDVRRHYADNTRLKAFIDFNPSPFEEVLPQVIDYYRKGSLT